jgi:hypothetical protein
MRHVLYVGLVLLICDNAHAQEKIGIDFFEKHIRPVLVAKCHKCHSADSKEVKGNLLLDTRKGIRAGGDSGKAVVPGNIEDSILLEAIRWEGLEMPPNEQLPADVIALFEKWIKIGAPDPRDGDTTGIRRTIDFETAREFWAFRPIEQPAIPQVKGSQSNWPVSDIDRFVLARLQQDGLSPVGDAEPLTLVRRIYFDLIGLPPTPEQVDQFLADAAKDRTAAIASLIDRLLTSPQFGERWGRHWLDVVRYGESTGMERNATYPQAWRYRDYAIAAFNKDKPFNDFIREQVAGDRLPFESPEQRKEQVIATAFLAMGPKSLNGNNREKFAMDVADEQIDVTTRAFLGLTAACARCHDHKFDPIPQGEYYALAGIFRSTETFYGTVQANGNRNAGRLLAFSNGDVSPAAVKANPKGRKKSKTGAANTLNKARKRLQVVQRQLKGKPSQEKRLRPAITKAQAQVKKLEAQVAAEKKPAPEPAAKGGPPPELLMAVLDAGNPSDTELRLRGEPNDKGRSVPRGFLTIGSVGHVPEIEPDGSGRLELANWLTQTDNPLTARVAVNRIWQHLFGRGIVTTVDNFGANGERPTHPELLDWLATQMVSDSWSVKRTIRSIMLSRVYQLGSSANVKAASVDPDNMLLWRANHRRLEAEAMRDAMLLAAGQLDMEPGQKSLVAKIGDGLIGRNLQPAAFADDSRKRSVYLPIVRGILPEILRVFDFPEPSIISGRRDVTTVPTQALYLMNSEFVIGQSTKLAERLLADPGLDDSGRIELAYRLTLCRLPSDVERDNAESFVEETATSLSGGAEHSPQATLKAWSGLTQALLGSAEFRYVE